MTRPTYAQQERHLHEQYLQGKIKPYDFEFCICGNMKGEREEEGDWPELSYSICFLNKIEFELLSTIRNQTVGEDKCSIYGYSEHLNDLYECRNSILTHPNYETALFNGMVAALKVLKEVHRSWGEDVDAPVKFTRRPQMA